MRFTLLGKIKTGGIAGAVLLTIFSNAKPVFAAVTEEQGQIPNGGTLRLQLFRSSNHPSGSSQGYVFKVCADAACTRRPGRLRERLFPVSHLIERYVGRGNQNNCSTVTWDNHFARFAGYEALGLTGATATMGLSAIHFGYAEIGGFFSRLSAVTAFVSGFSQGATDARVVENYRELTTALFVESILFGVDPRTEQSTRTSIAFSPYVNVIPSVEVTFGTGEAIRRRYSQLVGDVENYRMTQFRLIKGRLIEDLASSNSSIEINPNLLVELDQFDEAAYHDLVEINQGRRSQCQIHENLP